MFSTTLEYSNILFVIMALFYVWIIRMKAEHLTLMLFTWVTEVCSGATWMMNW